jgi:hypothetical protein
MPRKMRLGSHLILEIVIAAIVLPGSIQSATLQFDMQGSFVSFPLGGFPSISATFDAFLSYDPNQQPASITTLPFGEGVVASYTDFSCFIIVHDPVYGDQVFFPPSGATLSMNLVVDVYSLDVGDNRGTSVDLVDDSLTAFTGPQLPSSLNISEFDRTLVFIDLGAINPGSGVAGKIQSISLLTPEPNSMIFCGGGLVFLLCLAHFGQGRLKAPWTNTRPFC